MAKETKVKVIIAKSKEGDFAYKQRWDGNVCKSEPVELSSAKQAIKDLGLVQESKETHADGTTRYTYA